LSYSRRSSRHPWSVAVARKICALDNMRPAI